MLLKTENLIKHYGSGDNTVKAVDGIDIEVNAGEFIAVVGSSGSGKSTLLNLVGGLDKPTSGKILIEGKDIFSMKDDELTVFRRRRIGFVFQNYNLIPVLNVYENVILPAELDGNRADSDYIRDILETLGIWGKKNSLPGQLSGGQQQRTAIARALSTRPAILLADEPTGNLDSRTSQDVVMLFRRMNEKYNQTMLMITHNEEISQIADRIIRIEDGKIIGGRQ